MSTLFTMVDRPMVAIRNYGFRFIGIPVHPDPISGMHCWHQAVRVRKAEPGDRYGDVSVDTARARRAYGEWLSRARPAILHSPDGTRRSSRSRSGRRAPARRPT